MASLLDTSGGYDNAPGLPGAPATGSLCELDTVVNVSTSGGLDSAGMIDFGNVVAKDAALAADNAVAILGGSNLSPRGISSRRIKRGATPPTNLVGYATNDEFGVYRTGDVYCMAAENVKENDQVVGLTTAYSPSTGISTNVGGAAGGVANGSTRIAVPRHRWKTTTSQGQIGIVSVYGRDIAPATTS